MTDPTPDPAEDPSAPLFFLSYARARPLNRPAGTQADPNSNVKALFNQLSTHLNNLVYREGGADPGFMDITMAGGEKWTPELMWAVGTCQVLVALLSPAYLARPWCAKEWNAFAARTTKARGDGRPTTSILPVLWTSTRFYRVPESIGDVDLFMPARLTRPKLAQHYQDDGLYGLLTGNMAGTDQVVFRLAQRIAELYMTNHVEPRVVTDHETLPKTIR